MFSPTKLIVMTFVGSFFTVGFFISSQAVTGNYINQNPLQHNQLAHYTRQLVPTSTVGFREIDDLDRAEVLQFTLGTLMRTAAENDVLKRRQGNKLAYNDKLFHDDNSEDTNNYFELSLQQLFDKMAFVGFKVRNLTIIIALVYMDKMAQTLHLYANSRTVRKLFGGCLIIASKMHRSEISREQLADCMDISIRELVDIESAIVVLIKDLTVHPQVLINYLTPLMGSKSSQNTFTQSDRGQHNYYQ